MVTLRATAGFTLIELVITIAIVAMLLLVGMPYTRDWIDGVRQMRAKSNVIEAVGQARALAMRNPCGHPVGAGVVRLDYDASAQTLSVLRLALGGVPSGPCAAEGAVWSAAIASPGDLAIKPGAHAGRTDFDAATDAFACAVFDSRGRLLDAGGCVAATQSQVSIVVGNQEPLHAPLL